LPIARGIIEAHGGRHLGRERPGPREHLLLHASGGAARGGAPSRGGPV